MANLFRNELAIILGILVANQFSGRVFRYRPPGVGLSQVYIPEPQRPMGEPKYGTGRGGYALDYNGDDGKPGLGDETMQLPDIALCGSGGEITRPGAGLFNGLFGEARKFYGETGTISAGPGGGWFTGGWSFVGGGSGGASSFVLSEYAFNELTLDLQYKIIDYYLSLLPDEEREQMTEEQAAEYIKQFFGVWYDRIPNVYNREPWLYGLNTREKYMLKEQGNVIMYGYRKILDGNGGVLISNVNTIISYPKTGETDDGEPIGEFINRGYAFYYTGETQEWTVPADGVYHIICYGACGGDRWRNKYPYLGGFGGCASGLFNLKAGTKLYIDVGGRGQRYSYSFPNGSKGLGGCTGGGGESCVRYNPNIQESRIIVAGGGGGIFAIPYEPDQIPDDKEFTEVDTDVVNPPRDENGNPVEKDPNEDEARFTNMKFMVNDQSIVHVRVKSYNQIEIPDFAKTSCSIYINDGDEGELHTTVKPEGGVWTYEFQFPLNTIYPPNTPTHEVTIEAIIKTNFYSILATDGIMIWVTTNYKLTDATKPDNKIKIYNQLDNVLVEDYYEIYKLTKRQITLDLEEQLGIDDFYDLILKIKNNHNIDISELLDMDVFYSTEIVRKYDGEKEEYSEEELDDDMVVSLVHLTYLYSNIEELLGFEDFVELELIKGV